MIVCEIINIIIYACFHFIHCPSDILCFIMACGMNDTGTITKRRLSLINPVYKLSQLRNTLPYISTYIKMSYACICIFFDTFIGK